MTKDYIRSMNGACDDDVDGPELQESGLQLLSGRQAMGYMRNRYAEGGDFGRMERQSKVMEAVIAKVSDQSYLELVKLAEECLPYVETNLTLAEIIDYGRAVLGFDLKNIEQTQVPQPDNEECLPYVETNLTLAEIIDYGRAVLGFDLKNIEQTQVPQPDNGSKSVDYKGYSPFYMFHNLIMVQNQ